jgi:hypothetical protein
MTADGGPAKKRLSITNRAPPPLQRPRGAALCERIAK